MNAGGRPFRWAVWGLALSVAVGATFALVASAEVQIALVVALLGGLLGLALALVQLLEERLAEIRQTRIAAQKLFAVVGDGVLEGPFSEMADAALRATAEDRGTFLRARAVDVLHNAGQDLASVARGSFDCKPDEEPHLTKEALLTCETTLRAVSFEDEPWWEGSHGARYLELHRLLLRQRNDVQMIRVFLLDGYSEGLDETLRRNVDAGVEAYAVPASEVPRHCRRDLVIYDEVMVREARVRTDTVGKAATFTIDRHQVSKALKAFETVLELARASAGARR